MRRLAVLLIAVFSAVLMSAEEMLVSVTAYNAVELSGDVPESAVASYLQYQKNSYKSRLSAGDSAVLEITGLDEGLLESLTLSVRSNKASGAAAMTLSVGGEVVWSVPDSPFNDENWYGAWSSEYVDITHYFTEPVLLSDVRLVISASANSFYFSSAKFTYDKADPLAFSVGFYTQTDLRCPPRREVSPGSGVVLPTLPDPDSVWHFVGWTEKPYTSMQVCPAHYKGGEKYYPSGNTLLYALYTTADPNSALVQVTDFRSGTYAIVSPYYSAAAYGGVTTELNHKHVATLPCEMMLGTDSIYRLMADSLPYSCWYDFVFDEDIVTIRNLATDNYIGVNASGQMSDVSTNWHWKEAALHTLALREDADETIKSRTLYIQSGTGINTVDSVWLYASKFSYVPTTEYLALFPVRKDNAIKTVYSSYPVFDAVETIAAHEIDWSAPVAVYSAEGRLVMHGLAVKDRLPKGLWIIRQGRAATKLLITK